MAAGGVHHLAQCITCHAWNADMSSTWLNLPLYSPFISSLFGTRVCICNTIDAIGMTFDFSWSKSVQGFWNGPNVDSYCGCSGCYLPKQQRGSHLQSIRDSELSLGASLCSWQGAPFCFPSALSWLKCGCWALRPASKVLPVWEWFRVFETSVGVTSSAAWAIGFRHWLGTEE